MRLGKELATGVIEVPAGAGCIPLDEPREDGAHEQRTVVEHGRIPELADKGALITSR